MRPAKYRKDKTPIFIEKLHRILEDQRNEEVISWTPQRNGFVILDLKSFTTHVLPQYFKHSNLNSFIRQLNMYRFTKVRHDGLNGEPDHVYQNDLFLRDDHSQLKEIRRKETTARTQSLVPFKENCSTEQWQEREKWQQSLDEKLGEMKDKQKKLDEVCCTLLSQNQMLMKQNQQLANKVRVESKKKDRIMKQVFRIVGASITEFWADFCEEDEGVSEKQKNLQDLYEVFVQFIDQYDLSQILQILDYFLGTSNKKVKTFKVISENESSLLHSYSEEEIRQFLTETSILLKPNQPQ